MWKIISLNNLRSAHLSPASSIWPLQKTVWPIPLWWQLTSRDSVLVQFNSSRTMGAIPWPKKALFTGVAPVQVKLTDQENNQVKKHYFNACQWRSQDTADGSAQLASSPGSLLKNEGRREPGNIRGKKLSTSGARHLSCNHQRRRSHFSNNCHVI